MKQLIFLALSLSLLAQFRDPGSWKVTRVGASANRPATCQANRDAFVCSGSGCSPNPSLEFCTATNTFTAFSGGGSGTVTSVDAGNGVETVSGSAITSTGTIRGAIAINAQTGTTYTVLTGDRGKLITHSNGSAIAVTLPQAGVSFPVGWFTYVQNLGAGTVTITPTTSTIDGAASLALTTNQGTIIVSDGTNYFTMRGVGTAGSGTVTSVATTSPITGGTITGSGTIACATCVTSAASLTSNLPVIGAGGQATAVGTVQGNTTKFATYAGSAPSTNDCAKFDANGNITTAGAACGSGGSGNTTSTGATASASAGTSGNVYFPNDGVYLLRDSGSAMVPWGPIFPHIDPTLTSFSWSNQGSATVSTTYGGVYLSAPATSGNSLRVRYESAPGTPWTRTLSFKPDMNMSANPFCGIALRQSSTGKLHTISLGEVSAGSWTLSSINWTNETTFSAYRVQQQSSQMFAYQQNPVFKVGDDGTNITFSVCSDPMGLRCQTFDSFARGTFMTGGPDQVGFFVSSGNASNAAGIWVLGWK